MAKYAYLQFLHRKKTVLILSTFLIWKAATPAGTVWKMASKWLQMLSP